MKYKREPLPVATQLWLYIGSTVVLFILIFLGYRVGRNLALPAFLAFLVLLTVVGAYQDRSVRSTTSDDENLLPDDAGNPD